ncbi:cupin domain-containing protein [Mesorhizobium sp. M7A.F.Ca.US.011.01.1.1]|nr:cupin domain-containing protein [Mesorhizobium sp. M7A.F.Ca.US.011.01.1.1]RUX22427.1 cupin domain-containing protein [Mesorhizobium sp. M7A.F.Ca.US.011.01.1.1]
MSLAPQKFSKGPYSATNPNCRFMNRSPKGAWTAPILMEWELTGESVTDEHVHDEFAYVIEGKLFVEADGVTVEANAGDTVCVPAGALGRYSAPEYARILGVYAPNPSGIPAKSNTYAKISGQGDSVQKPT